ARAAGLFGAGPSDRDLADEMAAHLALEIDENMRNGMSNVDARRAALVAAGGIEAAKEADRDQRGVPVIAHLVQDVRYGLRMLRKNPAFSLVAILSLALAIGANTAVFSLTNAALIKPLAVDDPESLVFFEWISGKTYPARSHDGSTTKDP